MGYDVAHMLRVVKDSWGEQRKWQTQFFWCDPFKKLEWHSFDERHFIVSTEFASLRGKERQREARRDRENGMQMYDFFAVRASSTQNLCLVIHHYIWSVISSKIRLFLPHLPYSCGRFIQSFIVSLCTDTHTQNIQFHGIDKAKIKSFVQMRSIFMMRRKEVTATIYAFTIHLPFVTRISLMSFA